MSDEKDVTGPTDDEEYGHGGVEVPTDHQESLPPVQEQERDVDRADAEVIAGDA
jgi:hypothetical protein